MIGGPFTRRAAIIRVIGKALSPFIAVPFLHPAEPRPDSVDGMLGVRTKMSEFPGKHGRAPCGIDKPAACGHALARIDNGAYYLSIPVAQLEACYLRRAPESAPRLHRLLEHVRVKFCAIQLKTRQPALITCADLDAIVKALIRPVRKPQAQSLFGQLMMPQVMCQS